MSKFTHHPYLSTRDNTLWVEDVNTIELAAQYGTPLYVYSKQRILDNAERMVTAFENVNIPTQIYYAVKCNNNLALLHLLREAGLGADVSDAGEIELARYAGFPREKMIYSGNNNPEDELAESLKHVDQINLDDISLLPTLLRHGTPEILSFRINPGVGKGSHSTNVFSGKNAKFGITPEVALRAYQQAKDAGVQRFGIHTMPGSGGLDGSFFPQIMQMLFNTAETIAQKVGIQFEFIDLGGGFGIPYRDEETALDFNTIANEMAPIYHNALEKGHVGSPQLYLEPGRYIMGDSALLLGTVNCIKEGSKRFAGTDTGMNTLMRPALHGSYHRIVCANRADTPCTDSYTIVGRICENTDQHPEPRQLPTLQVGDLLATLDAGAYGFSMATNFNTYGRPAEVLVEGARHHLIRKRETLEDIKRLMVVPQA